MQQDNTTEMNQTPNSGETVVKTTPSKQGSTPITQADSIIKEHTQPLTAEEIKFTRLVAKGITYTSAYRQSFPHKNKRSYEYIRRLAFTLAARADIKTEIETVKDTKAKLARLAEDRIEQILVEDRSDTKGSKVADVAMFVYDHANGKATQRIETTSKSVSVNIDLTGTVTDEQASERRQAHAQEQQG